MCTICCWHRRIYVVRSNTRGGTVCYDATGCVCCEITHDKAYHLLLALTRMCCKVTNDRGYDVFGGGIGVCVV